MSKPVYLGMSILDISETLMYIFWYDYIKPKSIKIMLHVKCYVTWIPTASLFILKLKIFIKALQLMLKNGLAHQIITMMLIDHFQ